MAHSRYVLQSKSRTRPKSMAASTAGERQPPSEQAGTTSEIAISSDAPHEAHLADQCRRLLLSAC